MNRIVFEEDGRVAIVIPTGEFTGTMDELAESTVPQGLPYEIVGSESIPTDRTFRDAWEYDIVEKVKVNIVKAKDIAHSKRRDDRDKLFAPLDIQATIPSQAQQAEAERQAIRDADAQKQIAIDNASSPEELKTILGL